MSARASAQTVRVELGERSYEVAVGAGVLDDAAGRVRAFAGERATQAFVVADSGVPTRRVRAFVDACERDGLSVRVAIVTPSEKVKTLETVRDLLEQLAATGQDRAGPVVAIGGGIVGDVAGFVAASYRRGVPIVQCPTTLLAMVDASVGGKTGVNLEIEGTLEKNMAGAFHQPLHVAADVSVLESLPPREVRAGLAECVKHAMIEQVAAGTSGLFEWTERSLDDILAGDLGALTSLVARNVAVKARVVAGDERETAGLAGGRALLNLGHTFGHAIETLPGIAAADGASAGTPGLLHGEAVALGLLAACACGEALGESTPELGERVRGLLERIGLPTRASGVPSDEDVIARMRHDKKVSGGSLRVIVPGAMGSARVVEDPDLGAVRAGIGAIRA